MQLPSKCHVLNIVVTDKTAENGETVDEVYRNLITEHLGKELVEDLTVLKIKKVLVAMRFVY
jgi:hypothetical protein